MMQEFDDLVACSKHRRPTGGRHNFAPPDQRPASGREGTSPSTTHLGTRACDV
jgi:hypothetical protein